MDNLRIFLWVGFALLIWIAVQTWQTDYAKPQPSIPAAASAASGEVPPAPGSEAAEELLPALPALPGVAATNEVSAVESAPVADSAAVVSVRTDVLDLEIGLVGGDIRRASLPAYPIHKDQPNVPVTLLNPDPATLYLFHNGLRAADGQPEPNHLASYTATQTNFSLADGEDTLVVTLYWNEGPLKAEKIYRLRRGHYDIQFEYRLTNEGQSPYRAVAYQQIQRRHLPMERSMFNVDTYSFTGPVVYNGQKYQKLPFDDLADEPFEQTVANGWLASIQHHFLTAVVPAAGQQTNYQVTASGDIYQQNAIGADFTSVAQGETVTFPSKLFIGPKLQTQLETTAPGLVLTVDYGRLTLLAEPLFWLLAKVHGLVGNWGWTIILVTFLIKLVFYKLTETSGRSMAKMRKMQPRLKALQDRFKDDREAMSKALMDLYKREKVNPAAGCLPMLIQIPFFIAFYWTLVESVEMRQAPFALWITDLSSRDPFFILPLLMGAAMWFQQKLNPAPPDPVQAKVMQFLPIMFTGMFAFFPAGLVLYWLTNSVLSMAQQWRINKVLGAD